VNDIGGFAFDQRGSYKTWTFDKLRFADTDLNGHVNNAAFATFCESGRVAFLYDDQDPWAPPGHAFVVVRLAIDFRAELFYPGSVDIGTRVSRIGRSSFTMAQGVFNGELCAATAESVCALIDAGERRAVALPDGLRYRLAQL
jgi:acyl-CoA thioester hydrolase